MTQERIRELTKTMLRKKLYVVLSKGGAAPEKIAEHLPHHLEYMIGLEKKGVLFASGPLAEADGKTRGDGLTIVRASERAGGAQDRRGRSVRRARAAQLRGAGVDGDGGLARDQGEFFRSVARAGVGRILAKWNWRERQARSAPSPACGGGVGRG